MGGEDETREPQSMGFRVVAIVSSRVGGIIRDYSRGRLKKKDCEVRETTVGAGDDADAVIPSEFLRV